jgi:tRNA threonylcarbamoyl adenosine modification protein (Sua5/YciO/YrdC/YwlC family)
MSSAPGGDSRVVVLPAAAPRAIEWAAERIAGGGVIALPTDTVYGVAASLAHPDALRRIYEIKGRDARNPLPVLVSSSEMVPHLALALGHDVELLLDRYWPGPLTIVVPAKPGMPDIVTAGGTTVGLRMPNHPLAIEVIAKAGGAAVEDQVEGRPEHLGDRTSVAGRRLATTVGAGAGDGATRLGDDLDRQRVVRHA